MDGSQSGDINLVAAGTYTEHVTINKALTLIGADRTTTIIDGEKSGVTVKIKTAGVTLSGFTVIGSGTTQTDAGIMLENVTACFVTNCTATANNLGIAIVFGGGNNISNNNVVDNAAYGIAVVGSTSNTIGQNTVSGNGLDAIVLENASIVGGPAQAGATQNSIIGNTINSTHDGIYIGENCHNNQITDGNVIIASRYGINVRRPHEQTITGNDIKSAQTGIRMLGSSGNTITGNNITNNAIGIEIYTIVKDSVVVQPVDNIISRNSISANTSYGLQCGNDLTSAINAVSNWWSSADGPSGTGQGSGDTVTAKVVFTPWYTDADLSNLVPYDLTLGNASIVEHAQIGSTVGQFVVNDHDMSDIHVFRLISGDGINDTDNASFTVKGSSLLTAVEFNYATQDSYNVFAEVNDGQGGTNWAELVVSVSKTDNIPVVETIKLLAVVGHALTFDIVSYCSNAGGDPLTVTVLNPPAGLVEREDGLLAFTGAEFDVGTPVPFNYTVSDGTDSAQGLVEIEVAASIEEYLNKTMVITYIVPDLGNAAYTLSFPAIWTTEGEASYSVLQRPDLMTGAWAVATDAELTFFPTVDGSSYGEIHTVVPVSGTASKMFYKVQATVNNE